jgi:hypothetical protein
VQQYLLNAPARDVQAMATVLQNSPEALQQARAQIAATLKRAAFGNNASGDAGMSAERYLNTLRALGPDRLRVFFTPEELVQFNLAGKVMSDIGSIPAGARGAVNTSGTAGAVMNLLSRVAENPMLRKIPFGRSIANQVGEMQTERAMNQALAAKAVAPKPAAQLSPEAQRAIRLLFAPAPVAAALLAARRSSSGCVSQRTVPTKIGVRAAAAISRRVLLSMAGKVARPPNQRKNRGPGRVQWWHDASHPLHPYDGLR